MGVSHSLFFIYHPLAGLAVSLPTLSLHFTPCRKGGDLALYHIPVPLTSTPRLSSQLTPKPGLQCPAPPPADVSRLQASVPDLPGDPCPAPPSSGLSASPSLGPLHFSLGA